MFLLLLALLSIACDVGNDDAVRPRTVVVDTMQRPADRRAVTTLLIANLTEQVPAEFGPGIQQAAQAVSKYFNLTTTTNAEIYIKVDYICNSATTHWANFQTGTCSNGTYSQSAAYMQQKYHTYCSSYGSGYHGSVVINGCPAGTSWYLGLDASAIPSGSIDLVSGMMHQFVHILGYRTSVVSSFGQYYNPPPISSFDAHGVYNNSGTYASGTTYFISDDYVLAGPTYFEEDPTNPVANPRMQLYTPAVYDSATQLHHWANAIAQNPDELSTGSNLLMLRDLNAGSSIRVLGDNTVRALSSLGFSMRNCSKYTSCDACSLGEYCYWCSSSNTCGDPSGDACPGKSWVTTTCPTVSTTSSTTGTSGSSAAGVLSSSVLDILYT